MSLARKSQYARVAPSGIIIIFTYKVLPMAEGKHKGKTHGSRGVIKIRFYRTRQEQRVWL